MSRVFIPGTKGFYPWHKRFYPVLSLVQVPMKHNNSSEQVFTFQVNCGILDS
jgi:hypothetical protein